MDSTLTIKKLGNLNRKHRVQMARYMNTKGNSERPGSTFKLPPAKFDTVPSASRTKSPMGMNKRCPAQGSTKSLQRSYSVESMDSNTDFIVASPNQEGITNNYNTTIAVHKQISLISFFNFTYKPST